MTKVGRAAWSAVTVVVLLCSNFWVSTPAFAVGGHVATAVLGQYDAAGNQDLNRRLGNNGSPASAVGFDAPGSTAIDPVRHLLFVTEYPNRRVTVHQLDSFNRPIDGTAEYVLGKSNFSDITTTGMTADVIDRPTGVAYDTTTKYLYVGDGPNNRVLVFDTATISNGMSAVKVLGQTGFGLGGSNWSAGRMAWPVGISVDESGRRLFVVERGNVRVLAFDITTVDNGELATGVLGQPGFGSNGAAVGPSSMTLPWGSDYDDVRKRLYVSDLHRVLVFDVNAVVNGEAATHVLGQPDMNTNTAGVSATKFDLAYGLAVDSLGQRLWVADRNNHRVMEFNIGLLQTGMGANDVYGKTDFVTSGYVAASSSSMRQVEDVVFDPVAGIIIPEYGNYRITFYNDSRAGRAQVAVTVDPWLTFGVNGLASNASCNGLTPSVGTSSSGSSVLLGATNAGANKIAGQTLTVGTNAGGGYTVHIKSAGQLAAGSNTIANLSAPNATPVAFPTAGTPAFGYTVDDVTLGIGTLDRFRDSSDVASPSRWAGLGASGEVVFEPANLPASNTYCVAYQVGVSPQTPSGSYSTTVTYTAVPIF